MGTHKEGDHAEVRRELRICGKKPGRLCTAVEVMIHNKKGHWYGVQKLKERCLEMRLQCKEDQDSTPEGPERVFQCGRGGGGGGAARNHQLSMCPHPLHFC